MKVCLAKADFTRGISEAVIVDACSTMRDYLFYVYNLYGLYTYI